MENVVLQQLEFSGKSAIRQVVHSKHQSHTYSCIDEFVTTVHNHNEWRHASQAAGRRTPAGKIEVDDQDTARGILI